MFDTFEYWPIDQDVAKRAGSLRNEYRRTGRPRSVPDTLMAAHAMLREATLVTGNVRDFPMPELKILRLDH
jgi:predicted nucleic acid-binding protein